MVSNMISNVIKLGTVPCKKSRILDESRQPSVDIHTIKMVKPNSSSKGEEEEDGPIAGEMNAGPTQLDVLGIGDKLFEQIFIHERFGDVSDEVCD